jgi:DNA invertase Pin-like site-specific DNA recombinase
VVLIVARQSTPHNRPLRIIGVCNAPHKGQFERDLIQERTRAGLTAAAARGRKGGRKPVITGEKLERARGIIGKRLTVREAATRLKVGKTALYEALRG